MSENERRRGLFFSMMDILSFVNELDKLYLQQSDDFKALVKPPKHLLAKDFERYVIHLWRYLDSIGDATEAEERLYKLVSDFMVDYDGSYLDLP